MCTSRVIMSDFSLWEKMCFALYWNPRYNEEHYKEFSLYHHLLHHPLQLIPLPLIPPLTDLIGYLSAVSSFPWFLCSSCNASALTSRLRRWFLVRSVVNGISLRSFGWHPDLMMLIFQHWIDLCTAFEADNHQYYDHFVTLQHTFCICHFNGMRWNFAPSRYEQELCAPPGTRRNSTPLPSEVTGTLHPSHLRWQELCTPPVSGDRNSVPLPRNSVPLPPL